MKDNPGNKTPISALGEFGLIDHLTGGLRPVNRSTIKAVGDDAAILKFGQQVVGVSTDLLLEGIHFNLMYTPLKHLGYKAVVVNLSDIYAMNMVPGQVTVSIGVSSRFHVEDLEELYSGIRLACEHYQVDLVGGDTSASRTGLVISVTALGTGGKKDVVYRSTAGPGDLICVSGDLGAAYMGLQVLERENRVFQEDPAIRPRLEGYDYVLERQLKPEARKDLVELFGSSGVRPTAMIDVSDGLSSDLLHICLQSGLGCRLMVHEIPVHLVTRQVAAEFHMEAETAALNGGEDYELLFTMAAADYEKIAGTEGIKVIGAMTSKGEKAVITDARGNEVELTARGFNQFRKQY